ncbi:probable glucuronosyltransferase Os03g0107900 [Zingiber officinale]|uniref:Exostosin GT47 domain-containing protein n=1 Tax=Zingiber officinale TaxID=94328 RepID=A0A8J5HDK2_ZINOF|nr:probable glucuronosyltransferase Os03g0107900 [Zingiber officinale]KAG6519507.1 hypothetical protein ZIOFF_023001 [Zingiber officinale]
MARRAQVPHHTHKALSLKKHYKWLLWFSLSVYLFLSTTSSYSSFLFLHPLRLNSNLPARALIEPKNPSSHSSLPKVYVYELPSRFNTDWLANERCGTHLFAAEVAIHEALLQYAGRSLDPEEADFFFLPVYVSCNFSTVNGFPDLHHARPLLAAAIELVAGEFPFWNRSRGRDHVLVASHDYGACFHAMEDVAIADGIPEFMKNSIILQTFGLRRPHTCQEAEHVLIPPYVPPSIEDEWPLPEMSTRDNFVFFRGKMEVHPKNVSGRFYSKRVRTEILRKYGGNPRFRLERKRSGDYRREMARSVFCLCPLGWAPWSPRLVEAVALGCVPVIVADDIRLPFTETVGWPEISLTVAEAEVNRLEEILDRVAATNLSTIQRNLWEPARRRALLFRRPMAEGDATWHVLRALEGMRLRQLRRPRDGGGETDRWR